MSLPNQRIELPSIKNIFDVINQDMSQPSMRQPQQVPPPPPQPQPQQVQPVMTQYQPQFLPPTPSPMINVGFNQTPPQQLPAYPTPTTSTRNFNMIQNNNNIQINDSKNNYTTSLKYYHNMYNNPQQRFTANIITSGPSTNVNKNSPPSSPLPHPMLTSHIMDTRAYSDQPNHLSLSSASSSSSTSSSILAPQQNINNINSIQGNNINNNILNNNNMKHNNKILKKHSVKRSNLPKKTVEILNDWLLNHLHDPYPTPHEKMELLERTGLTKIQLSNWFINVRRRKVFADHSNNSNNNNNNSTSTSNIGGNTTSVHHHQHTNSK